MDERNPGETQRCPTPPITELIGAGFDDVQETGRGGFGVVYRCTETALGRTVAVKVLTVDLDEENIARFFREQRVMGRLTGHPHIVNIFRVGITETNLPYIVMPYRPQGSLDARIRRSGPLALHEALHVGVKLAAAIETAHRLEILHRDIKPANILLTEYGEPELADFGIAHIVGGFETSSAIVTGSPGYTAPEVLEGCPSSPAADIYSLSATFFSALTGHAAFERRSGEQVVAQFLRITTKQAPDLREHGVPADLSAVIARGMARLPDQRPATAAEFGEQLQQVQRHHDFTVDEMALRTASGTELGAEGRERERWPRSRYQARDRSTLGETGTLPRELNSFVGRRAELAAIRRILSTARLVTLTGIGGVGKTRLARQAATSVQQRFPDGVWLVELGELRDPRSVIDLVAAKVGVREHTSRPLQEVLVEALSVRKGLLMLDNCEHVVEAVASLAEALLEWCPDLRILATSRESLGLDSETVWQVSPLSIPELEPVPSLRNLSRFDSVTLFVERASVSVPGFELTDDNKEVVARICGRLEGLPLAIELAVARLRALTPIQVLQRLTDRFSLLTRGSRLAPTRHQTLRWSIGWSYELCSPGEQQLWDGLSLFAGSFELEAAEYVCGNNEEIEVLDAVSSLVDKSIVIREELSGVVRFRLLDTVREYGREKLASAPGSAELRERHRDWYEQLALTAQSEWISPHQLDWISRIGQELNNFREALEFGLSQEDDSGLRIATSLYSFWLARGLLTEGRRWIDKALAQSQQQPSTLRIEALYAAIILAGDQGDLVVASSRFEQMRVIASQLSDRAPTVLVEMAAGWIAVCSGDRERARICRDNLDISGMYEDLQQKIAALAIFGWIDQLLGDTSGALAKHQEACKISESHGEYVNRTYALWASGIAVWSEGNRDRATKLIESGLRLTRRTDDPVMAFLCLQPLAWITTEKSDPRRAAVMMGAADSLGRWMGSAPVIFPSLAKSLGRWMGSPPMIFPSLFVDQTDFEQSARRQLGDSAFDAARRLGSSMGPDAAIAYALGESALKSVTIARTGTNLTQREDQVAILVAEGLTNKDIADRLIISQRTVQGHVEHILTKLGYNSRVQIAAWVVKRENENE